MKGTRIGREVVVNTERTAPTSVCWDSRGPGYWIGYVRICLHNGRHSINLGSFHTLLGDQFTQTLDTDCDKLGVSGALGALFHITLASHDYTLVAKGTVSVLVEDLQHEMKMYQHLVHLQGTQVPVCLGSLDLTTPYYYDAGIEIVHMMLLSWAGKPINVVCPDFEDAANKVQWSSRQVEAFSSSG